MTAGATCGREGCFWFPWEISSDGDAHFFSFHFPSCPSSAWARSFAKLCFVSGRPKWSFAESRAQAKLGHKGLEQEVVACGARLLPRHLCFWPALRPRRG